MKTLFRIYRFFCSLKLAVITLSALIVLFAIGTFYESGYGRIAAQEVIYRSFWMTALLCLLGFNISAVMLDRWPWKKKHIPFLLAHFGIIFMIVGAFVTRFYGVDGNLKVSLQEEERYITTSESLFMVYASFDAKNLTELYRDQVYFFRHPPTGKKPYVVSLGDKTLKVKNFYANALGREKYDLATKGGPAIRFQLEGSFANINRWLFKPPWKDRSVLSLGPVELVLLKSFSKKLKKDKITKPTLLLTALSETELKYQIYHPDSKTVASGVIKKGDTLKTGWMDFQFRLIEYMPKALPNTVFTPQKQASSQTYSAIEVEFSGESRWMGLNSHLFFFDKNKVYIVAYVNKKKPLGFSIKLEDFKRTRYPNSFKASSYESVVRVQQGGERKNISMNHPLKFSGYTIYQSGFEENEIGEVTASIFAVNQDPGRFIKYFGSFLIVLGCISLFLKRNIKSQKMRS